MFISLFSRIIIIFSVILVGTLARWRKLLTQETTDGLSRLAMEVTLPCLYFYTLSTNLNRQLFFSILKLPLFAVGLTFISFFFGWLFSFLPKLDACQRRTFVFLVTFPNYGFLAIPLIFALYGQEGLVHLFVFNLGITFLYWTLGVTMLSGPTLKVRKVFKNLVNNATLALVLGLVAGISAFPVPQLVLETANLIGTATIPLVLVVVGSILAQKDLSKAISFKTIAAVVFCRLILMPAVALLLLNRFNALPKIWEMIMVLQAALPSASTTPILTRKFGGDTELAASGVFFTTLFSLISVPLLLSSAWR